MQISQSVLVPRLYLGINVNKRFEVSMRKESEEHKLINLVPLSEKLFEYISAHFLDNEVNFVHEAYCCCFSYTNEFLNHANYVKLVNLADIPRTYKQIYQRTVKNELIH